MAIPGTRRRQASNQSVFKGDDASEGRHAIALAKNATAILMDKPTSGLAPQASNEFSQLVKMLGQQRTTVLMATHDLYRAKDIGIMGQGLCRIRQTWRCESLGTRSDRASNHAVSIEFLLRRNPARHFSLGVTTSFDDVDVTEAFTGPVRPVLIFASRVVRQAFRLGLLS